MSKKLKLANLAISGLLAGGLFAACQNPNSSASGQCSQATVAKSSAAAPSTISLKDFEANCKTAGGKYEKHGCNGHNTCKGTSVQDGILYENNCNGLAKCEGASCVGAKVSATPTGLQTTVRDNAPENCE